MMRLKRHLSGTGVERKDAHAGNYAAGATTGQILPFPPLPAIAEPRRRNVPNLRDETAAFVIHDDDAAARHGGDIGSAAASGQTNALAVFFYPVRVEIPETVD